MKRISLLVLSALLLSSMACRTGPNPRATDATTDVSSGATSSKAESVAKSDKATGKTASSASTKSSSSDTEKKDKATAVATMPEGEVVPLDSFEDGNYWVAVADSWDKWGGKNYSLNAETVTTWATDGTNSGDWVFNTIKAGGMATFYCDALAETDWTGVKYIVLDANNPASTPLKMNFSCQTSDKWTWIQTKTVDIQPGIGLVVIDLTKGLADGTGKALTKITDADLMKRAMFNIVYAKSNGHFYVDNIRLIK